MTQQEANSTGTNARGRIQSANLTVRVSKTWCKDLSAPTDIVLSDGYIYWTEGDNSVRRVSMSGEKIVQDIAANLGSVGGLAVGGGKVYWTEMTAAGGGTINSANLDGTNLETLATLLSAPMGISVDTAGSKLYWTNARVESSVRTSTVPVSKTSLRVLGSPG